jgi:glycosyltransferase involved in cell wall biosynthesis
MNIKYFYQKNKGVSSARNNGIKKAKNKWIAFCDSDDIWHEEKLKKQVLFHKQNPNIKISHTDETWIFNNKIKKKKSYQKKPFGFCFIQNLRTCLIGTSSVLLHKDILEDIGLFDDSLIACEDYDLYLRILQNYELGFINEELIIKNAGHKGQLSFDIPFLDIYKIKALQKHTKSKYSKHIKDELNYKINILKKGAIKHNNQLLLNEITKIQQF